MKTSRDFIPCPGPHPDRPGRRHLGDVVCVACWRQLPEETRSRLKLSGGSGRIEPVVRFNELRAQLAAGTPLGEIEVTE